MKRGKWFIGRLSRAEQMLHGRGASASEACGPHDRAPERVIDRSGGAACPARLVITMKRNDRRVTLMGWPNAARQGFQD